MANFNGQRLRCTGTKPVLYSVYKQLPSEVLPVRFQLSQKMNTLALLILGAFLANAAPRPSTPIGNTELEVRTSMDKREVDLRTTIDKIKADLRTTMDKREADPMPPIGSCGC